MDSVYDAALTHAEKLKAELETLQNFLDLHNHFRERFGLTSSAPAEAAAESETKTPVVDHAAATHEIHVKNPVEEVEDAVEADAPEAQTPLQAEAESEVEPDAEAEPDADGKPRVIQASEGVLIAPTSEASAGAPLGPEATLQSVAEKLAATISASHPSVTGYTV
jgi:hypothetical protein